MVPHLRGLHFVNIYICLDVCVSIDICVFMKIRVNSMFHEYKFIFIFVCIYIYVLVCTYGYVHEDIWFLNKFAF